MKCEKCNSNKTIVKNYLHDYTIKGKKVSFKADRRFCELCGELVFDEELDNKASLEAIKIFNKIYGITGKDIVALRKKYHLSQELFSKVIGCAKKTLVSYELDKSIPNDTYMIILNTLMKSPKSILLILDSNKEVLEKNDYEKIKEKIDITNYKEFVPTSYNGFTEKNMDKIKNLFRKLAENGIQKTKLLKEMFYIDFLNYKINGESLTGLQYAKLNYGPVPDKFEELIKTLEEESVIKQEVTYQNNYEYHNISSSKKFNKKVFNEKELQIIEEVITYFQDFNTSEIVAYSHKEKAFTETTYYKNIDYDYAFEIKLE